MECICLVSEKINAIYLNYLDQIDKNLVKFILSTNDKGL